MTRAMLRGRSLALTVVLAIATGLAVGHCLAASSAPDDLGDGSAIHERFGGPLSAQGGAPVTSFAGVVDPTNTAYAGGMIASTSASPGSAVLAQNAAAFVSAATYASTHNVTLYLPPGRYPSNDIDLDGISNLTVQAYNVTLARAGDASGSDTALLRVHHGAHIKISGITFSQRDLANTDANDVLVKIGDGGTNAADDVTFVDDVFLEGHGGDCVRMDGGSSTATVTRVSITRARFEGCGRAGVDVRPGVQSVSVTWSSFQNNPNRDIYFEATSDNSAGQVEIIGNSFERGSSTTAAAITLAGFGTLTNSERSHVKYNRVLSGVIEAVNIGRTQITANYVVYDVARGSTANIDVSGVGYDVWVDDNYLLRTTAASSGSLVRVAATGSSAMTDIWVRGNRAYQYSGIAVGVDLTGAARFNVLENDVTYHGATADSGSTGFVGLFCTGGTAKPCSGVIARNRIKKDLQSDGVTAAGRMLAGVQVLKGSQTTVHRLTVRDNVVDGAQAGLWIDADGASSYPEGFPVIAGNFVLNSGGDIAGGITTYRNDSTVDAEVVSSGALDVARHISFLTTAGIKAYTLGDGAADGFVKCEKITAATSTPAGTLTPTHFADGTTHTLTWSAAGGYACEMWDATNTTWRLLGSSGVTLN